MAIGRPRKMCVTMLSVLMRHTVMVAEPTRLSLGPPTLAEERLVSGPMVAEEVTSTSRIERLASGPEATEDVDVAEKIAR